MCEMLSMAAYSLEFSVNRQRYFVPGAHDVFAHFQAKLLTERIQDLLVRRKRDHANVPALLELLRMRTMTDNACVCKFSNSRRACVPVCLPQSSP